MINYKSWKKMKLIFGYSLSGEDLQNPPASRKEVEQGPVRDKNH
jgi:hypothetical protein